MTATERQAWPSPPTGFLAVPDFPGYAVDSDGVVIGCRPRKVGGKPEKWRMVKHKIERRGYRRINISIDAKVTTINVHQLVLLAFVGPRPVGMQACHNNGNPGDCRLSNLRYDTPTANQHDKRAHGTHLEGEANPTARLTRIQVREIRDMYAAGGITHRELAKRFGMSKPGICHILSRRSWAGVN